LKKSCPVLLLVCCLSLVAVPVHGMPTAPLVTAPSWWADVIEALASWLLPETTAGSLEKATCTDPNGCLPPPPPSSTTLDCGGTVDPNGCPKPKP
jgi:hypothetical protein